MKAKGRRQKGKDKGKNLNRFVAFRCVAAQRVIAMMTLIFYDYSI